MSTSSGKSGGLVSSSNRRKSGPSLAGSTKSPLRNSLGMNQSLPSASISKSTTLLKAALTRNVQQAKNNVDGSSFFDDSSINVTAKGAAKALAEFRLTQETPKALIRKASEAATSGEKVSADSMFNAAKEATAQRRLRSSRRIEMQQKASSSLVEEVEDDNLDPSLMASPVIKSTKQVLKRKSRRVEVRASLEQDDDKENDDKRREEVEEDTLDPSLMASPVIKSTKQVLKRKSRRVEVRASLEQVDDKENDDKRQEEVEAQESVGGNDTDSVEERVRHTDKLGLKRRRTTTMAKPQMEKRLLIQQQNSRQNASDASVSSSDSIIENAQRRLPSRRTEKKNTSSFRHQLDQIKRASTPAAPKPSSSAHFSPIPGSSSSLVRKVSKGGPRNVMDLPDTPSGSRDGGGPIVAHITPQRRLSSSEDVNLTFHPNVESTRLGLNAFTEGFPEEEEIQQEEEELQQEELEKEEQEVVVEEMEPEEVQKKVVGESRRTSTPSNRPLLVSQSKNPEDPEDAGSYVAPHSSSNKRFSAESMPPPLTVPPVRSSRRVALNTVDLAVLDDIDLDDDNVEVDFVAANSVLVKKRRPRIKKKAESCVLPASEIVFQFQRFCGAKLSSDAVPVLLQAVNRFTDLSMDHLRHIVHGDGRSDACLADVKQLMKDVGQLPENDPGNAHLYAKLFELIDDYEDRKMLIPMSIMDGTPEGRCTLPTDLWDRVPERDDDDDDDELVLPKRKTKRRKRKSVVAVKRKVRNEKK